MSERLLDGILVLARHLRAGHVQERVLKRLGVDLPRQHPDFRLGDGENCENAPCVLVNNC